MYTLFLKAFVVGYVHTLCLKSDKAIISQFLYVFLVGMVRSQSSSISDRSRYAPGTYIVGESLH